MWCELLGIVPVVMVTLTVGRQEEGGGMCVFVLLCMCVCVCVLVRFGV